MEFRATAFLIYLDTVSCGNSDSSVVMVLEEQRLLHEDLERLEQAVADRVLEEPKHVRFFVQ